MGSTPAISGDRPEFTYRASATEVRLTFSAVDQNDRGVATLQAGDFAVVDKGFIVRNFQSFTRTDYTRLEIAILLDSSESLNSNFRKEIADTVELLSQTSGVPEENLSLLSFRDGKPLVVCAGNCRSSAAHELPAARAAGLTPLYDTIVYSSDFLSHRADSQAEKILVLLSDGRDTVSRHSMDDALHSALVHEIQVYCIDMGGDDPQSGTLVLRSLANASGGRYLSAQNGAAQAVNLILQGFRSSYVVSYRLPTHAEGFHDVQILPTHNNSLHFRSRSGYYYPNYTR